MHQQVERCEHCGQLIRCNAAEAMTRVECPKCERAGRSKSCELCGGDGMVYPLSKVVYNHYVQCTRKSGEHHFVLPPRGVE